MSELYLSGVGFTNECAPAAEVVDLAVELTESSSPFVIDKCLRNKANFQCGVSHPDTEFDVFSKAVKPESAGRFKDTP